MRKMIAYCELNQVPILPEHINCQGCRTEGIKTVFCNSLCEIRQCALKRSVETCGDCPDMKKCKLVGMIISDNPDALKNLEMGDYMNNTNFDLIEDEDSI